MVLEYMAFSRNPLLFRLLRGKGPAKPNFFNAKKPPVQKASLKQLMPVLRLQARPKPRVLSRVEQIRNSAIRAERLAIIRRVNVPFELRLARVAQDVKARKLSFDKGALIIDGINAQRENALRRLGLR